MEEILQQRDVLCQCGCGLPAPIAKQTNRKRGVIKGQPCRYIPGHHNRKSLVDYIEEDRGHHTPCWIWQLYTTNKGRPLKIVSGKRVLAYRYYFQQRYGYLSNDLDLHHQCGVANCVNPTHVKPMTRGRHLSLHVRKLDESRVAKMRSIARTGELTGNDIAKLFGVSQPTVSCVLNRKTWKHVA